MRKCPITQKTEITVIFAPEISNDSCDMLIEKVVDALYTELVKTYPEHTLDFEWKKEKDEYYIEVTEEGTVDYYPGNDWYEPDDYDDPTTLCEDEIGDAMSDILIGDEENISFNIVSDYTMY